MKISLNFELFPKTFATENVNVIFVIFSSWKFSIVCSESFWKVCWLWQLLCHLLQVDRQAVNLPPPHHSWYANLISNQMQQFLEDYVLTWLAFYLSIYFIFKGNVPAKWFKSFANAKWVFSEEWGLVFQ